MLTGLEIGRRPLPRSKTGVNVRLYEVFSSPPTRDRTTRARSWGGEKESERGKGDLYALEIFELEEERAPSARRARSDAANKER